MNPARSALFDGILLSRLSSPVLSKLPPFLYGCAWKRERTADLVYQAISTGFRGIDVAAQPRHYREELAGQGMRRAIDDGRIKRGDLFIQTKYTPISGQGKNVPYDEKASITEQVKQSVASSLHNLRVSSELAEAESTYIDSVVLHSPLKTTEKTLEAWEALSSYVPNSIKFLGISNTTLPILQTLYKEARIKPKFVQNRFHKDTLYEGELRQFCRDNDIVFQSFWTLTGNPKLLKSPPVHYLAEVVEVDHAVALYAFVLALDGNISIMNGTTSHMASDQEGLVKIREWAEKPENGYEWENQMKQFKNLVGENNTQPVPRDEMYSTGRRKPMRGDVDDPRE